MQHLIIPIELRKAGQKTHSWENKNKTLKKIIDYDYFMPLTKVILQKAFFRKSLSNLKLSRHKKSLYLYFTKMVFRGFSWLSFWVLLFKNVWIIFVATQAVETIQKLFIFNVKVPNALLCHSKTYRKASNNFGFAGLTKWATKCPRA